MSLRWTLPVAVVAVVATLASVDAGIHPGSAPPLGGPVLLAAGAGVRSAGPASGAVEVVEPHAVPEPVGRPDVPGGSPAAPRTVTPGPVAVPAAVPLGTTAPGRAPQPPTRSPGGEREPAAPVPPSATRSPSPTPSPSRTPSPAPTPSHRTTP